MSKAKKPGTDLAALKARLAKKTKGGADVPAPGEVVPPPGQQFAPPQPEVPPPGEVAAPPPQVPPPGEQYIPEPAPPAPQDLPPPGHVAAPRPAAPAPMPPPQDDPFGGTVGATFDPDAGMIDAGEVTPRGSKGLVLFAALLAAGLGAVGGFIGNKIVSKRELIAQGQTRGEKMVAEVEAVSKLRKDISLEMETVKKEIAEDPAKAAETVTTLLTNTFDKHPKVDELFSWQLASVSPLGIKKTFALYAEAGRLQLELQILARFLTDFGPQIKAAGGPSLFGVTPKSNGMKLVSVLQPMCGEAPAPTEGGEGEGEGEGEAAAPAADSLKPCDDSGAAVGFKVIADPANPEPIVMLKGGGKDQVQVVVPDQEIYAFAIGLEPSKNALNQLDFQLKRITERLEAMNKAEKIALKALSSYAESPDVDGSNPQPDPAEE